MTYYTTQKDKLKYLRKVCRENGLVFKKDKNYWLNNNACYHIADRKTGKIVSNYHSINSAYDNEMINSFISIGYQDNNADYL